MRLGDSRFWNSEWLLANRRTSGDVSWPSRWPLTKLFQPNELPDGVHCRPVAAKDRHLYLSKAG